MILNTNINYNLHNAKRINNNISWIMWKSNRNEILGIGIKGAFKI